MRIDPQSPNGSRLRRHGVSSSTLEKARIHSMGWLPGGAMTLPIPFFSASILIRRDLLKWNAAGELVEGPDLAPLVHQLCHAHQRMEWGFIRYLWRHLWARLRHRDVPIWFSQVERECYQVARQTVEFYADEHPAASDQRSFWDPV